MKRRPLPNYAPRTLHDGPLPLTSSYGIAIIEIAKMFIALNQQYAENGADWVVDVDIDVPSLTAITDPETEKQDWLMILSTVSAHPLYQTPIGMRKMRNVMEETMSKFVRRGLTVTSQPMTRWKHDTRQGQDGFGYDGAGIADSGDGN